MSQDKKIQEVQDQATANLVVKTAQGAMFGLGGVVTLAILARFQKFRTWPLVFGTGAGFGQGLSERDFAYNAYCYEHGMDMSKMTGNCAVASDGKDCFPVRMMKCAMTQVKKLTGQ